MSDQKFFNVVTQEQHREVVESIKNIEKAVDRIDSRVTAHMVAEHKDFDELISVVKGGKIAAKIIGFLIAIVVAIGGTWEWLRHNFFISIK